MSSARTRTSRDVPTLPARPDDRPEPHDRTVPRRHGRPAGGRIDALLGTSPVTVDGWTAPGFDGVRHAFEKNFANGLEIGAAFAAYHRGEPVVDLWGGITDPATEQPWSRDTLALVFS